MEAFTTKFQVDELLIKQVGSWKISLRPAQVTLGSLVLSLARSCPEMGGLQPEETTELSEAFNTIEQLFQKTFAPDKVNYLALMMVDHQVHFHVIPRYKTPPVFLEKSFPDADWPKPPNVFTKQEIDLQQLRDFLRKAL